MAKTQKSIRLSQAEIQAFQQIISQKEQLNQQQATITASIFESRDINVKDVVQPIKLSDDSQTLIYSIEINDII